MKTVVKIQTLLWMVLALAQASAEDQPPLPIFGHQAPIRFFGPGAFTNSLAQSGDLRHLFTGPETWFCVEPNRLPLKPWDPEKDGLPIDLRAEVVRAWSMVVTQAHGELEYCLTDISLQRFAIPETVIERSGRPWADFSNQWLAVLSFDDPGSVQSRTFALFMDRTYALERQIDSGDLSLFAQPQRPLNREEMEARVALIQAERVRTQPPKAIDPHATMQQRDFSIPRVQWNPRTQPFPLELRAEIARARARVAEADPEAGASFALWGISIQAFTPAGAILAQNLSPLDHRFHWVVIFRFHHWLAPTIRPWEIYTLLDGTILAVVPGNFSF